MSLGITIDINGQVIERIVVQQTEALDDNPGGVRLYTLTEVHDLALSEGAITRKWRNVVRHRRKDGALHLAAKACEFVSTARRKR